MMTPHRPHVSPLFVSRSTPSLMAFVALIGFVLIGFTSAAHAEDEEVRRGAVSISYVYGFEDSGGRSITGAGRSVDDASGVSLAMTYRVNSWLASVVRGEYMNGFGFYFVDLDAGDVVGDDVRTEVITGTVGAKIYPMGFVSDEIGGLIEPFLEVGGGFAWADIDLPAGADLKEAGFVGRFSGGVDINVTDAFGLVTAISYVLPTGEANEFRYWSVSTGVQYRF